MSSDTYASLNDETATRNRAEYARAASVGFVFEDHTFQCIRLPCLGKFLSVAGHRSDANLRPPDAGNWWFVDPKVETRHWQDAALAADAMTGSWVVDIRLECKRCSLEPSSA
jgi:hypothetical protein